MKETTKMSRAVGQLEKMYNVLNMDKFDGALPTPIITVQSKKGTRGHCSYYKVWERNGEKTYEINLAIEALDMPIEHITDTLIHEMVHMYCRENDIQEVSRGGKYHNSRFKEEAEKRGLVCIPNGQYGWGTHGENESLLEYVLSKGWNELKIRRDDSTIGTALKGKPKEEANQQREEKRPSSTRKLQCPCCGNSVRATKAVNIICGDCMERMTEV